MNPLAVLRKVTRTIRDKGVGGFLRVGWNAARIAVVKQSPARRRARREAEDFDRRHGTDTAGMADVDADLPNAEHAVRYQPSGREELEEIFRTLTVDFPRFTFVDIGSGKGRVLLFASDQPFRRIVGVEFSPRLHAIAVENARVYQSPSQRCRELESVCADATTVALPAGPLFVYLYNPFAEPVVRQFAANLERQWRAAPRELWLVYLNPVARSAFDGADWLQPVREGTEWVAWRSRP